MKAVVYEKYGSPDVLELREVETPAPKDDEVLVRIHAVSINDWDWALLPGTPLVTRLMSGLFSPRQTILGSDIAGRIEAIGKNVKRFKSGDEVFGDLSPRFGGFAEYVCAPETALALKPPAMTFVEAAAIPQAAMLAVQGLRDRGGIQSGQKLLINGAGGGVGTFALQIAKLYGAEVTGVDSAAKLDFMRSLGFDKVIDYTQEDFTVNGIHYDLILDVKTNRSVFDYASADIRVVSGGAPQEALRHLAPEFEQATGHRVELAFELVTEIQRKLAAGEKADVIMLPVPLIATTEKTIPLRTEGRIVLARVGIGASRARAQRRQISPPPKPCARCCSTPEQSPGPIPVRR